MNKFLIHPVGYLLTVLRFSEGTKTLAGLSLSAFTSIKPKYSSLPFLTTATYDAPSKIR